MQFQYQVTNSAGDNLIYRVTLVPSGAGMVCHMHQKEKAIAYWLLRLTKPFMIFSKNIFLHDSCIDRMHFPLTVLASSALCSVRKLEKKHAMKTNSILGLRVAGCFFQYKIPFY